MRGVSAPLIRRPELGALQRFLSSANEQPSGLLFEGEAGIGKTTVWQAAIERAREQGFRVLAARPGAAEVVLTYAVLADVLGDEWLQGSLAVDWHSSALHVTGRVGLPDVARARADQHGDEKEVLPVLKLLGNATR